MLAIEFGSKGRGDYDCYSDKDILIVGKSWPGINHCKNFYTLKGYSVSCVNFDKANYLTRNGSLFFKHIFDEGKIISGNKIDYEKLKFQWVSQKNYEHEIEDNIDQLEILRYLPKNKYGALVAIDILISSIRNILIRKLAVYGHFIFSWDEIFNKSSEIGLIEKYHIETLRHARRIKNSYRNGIYTAKFESTLKNISSIARYCIDRNFKIIFSNNAIVSLPEKYVDGSYKQLRSIEMLCAHYEFNSQMAIYSNAVKSPNYFCSRGLNKIINRTEIGRYKFNKQSDITVVSGTSPGLHSDFQPRIGSWMKEKGSAIKRTEVKRNYSLGPENQVFSPRTKLLEIPRISLLSAFV